MAKAKNITQAQINAFLANGKKIRRAPIAHVGFTDWMALNDPTRPVHFFPNHIRSDAR